MNEGLHVNGITLGGGWDAEQSLQKDLHGGFGDTKLMNGAGSSSNSPTGENNTSSVSTMLESLRSNLSQIYSGENLETPTYPHMNIKTESPVRTNDFCNDENTFSQQREQLSHNDANQAFDLYNPAITSVPSSMQRQFNSIPYDTSMSNMINTALFSQQQGYPQYPLPVKPEPTSPNSTYQLNPYYLGGTNGQALYPPTSMNLNQIDYQGYRLSDMMLPSSFGTQEQLKPEKFQTLNPESDPVLAQQLLGLTGGAEQEQIKATEQFTHHHHSTESVAGPMRIRRIKRPIPAGPSYPVHLWQFILELLGDHSCKDFIAWTGNDLEFKVINSRELARRWGRRKNNARMNFDKLSRAMRYYYEKNIIKHIPGQRLVYRYCRNPDDIVFTQLLKTAMGTLPPETRLIAPVTTNPHFTNAHSLNNSFNPLTAVGQTMTTASLTSHFGTSLASNSSNMISSTTSPIQHLNTPTLNSTSSIMSPSSHHHHHTSPTGLHPHPGGHSAPLSGLATSGLPGGSASQHGNVGSMSEYMFSTNCLSQVQQHIQQTSGSEGVVKQHHMMAS